ncbi:MAG: endonuclease/exonuclease/phosphatase family protein [Shimia sp.]
MRRIGATACLSGACIWIGALFGRLHPALDALALAWVPAGAMIAVGLIAWRGWGWMAMAGGVVIVAATPAFAPTLAAVPGHPWRASGDAAPAAPPIRLYQRNLWAHNDRHASILAEIARLSPDVVTFQEAGTAHAPLLAALASDYPHRHVCTYSDLRRIAILSRFPPTSAEPICTRWRAFGALQVEARGAPLWIVAVHLPRPWPLGNAVRAREVGTGLASLTGPMIVAGDFNMVPWSAEQRRLRRVAGLRRIGPQGPTLVLRPWASIRGMRPVTAFAPAWGVPLPLDRVAMRGGAGRITRLPRLGSDHMGLFAELDP